jgi:hypothetical protein
VAAAAEDGLNFRRNPRTSLRQPAIAEQSRFMSTRPKHCDGSFGLYRNDYSNTELIGTSSGKVMRSIV